MLKTKCYRSADDSDGLKISIMRFTPKSFSYDRLMLDLSPTSELLRGYRAGRINWQQYEERFRDLLADNTSAVDRLIGLATERDVTIYCSERTPAKCHRRLVAEEVKRRMPDLDVVIL